MNDSQMRDAAGGAETPAREDSKRADPRAKTRGVDEATGPAASANFWERLQTRWGVSTRDAIFILIAFALAGMTVLKIGSSIVNAIVPAGSPKWLWWTVKVLVVVPVYEVLLLTYGTLLGQRRFFIDKQRRLLRLIAKPFRRR